MENRENFFREVPIRAIGVAAGIPPPSTLASLTSNLFNHIRKGRVGKKTWGVALRDVDGLLLMA